MQYIRKTIDEWEIHTNYGYGWEVELTESSRKEARDRVREYRENAQNLIGIKIIKKRIKKTESKN